jgi:hypothetical protein
VFPQGFGGWLAFFIVFFLETRQPNARKKLPHYIGLNMPDFIHRAAVPLRKKPAK